jgi:transposase-like protein
MDWSPKDDATGSSLTPGVRGADVARKYEMCAQQLTARSWRLALVADDAAEFVAIELSEPPVANKISAKIEIAVGKVVLRLENDTASTRVAEIVSALERGVWSPEPRMYWPGVFIFFRGGAVRAFDRGCLAAGCMSHKIEAQISLLFTNHVLCNSGLMRASDLRAVVYARLRSDFQENWSLETRNPA